MIRDAMIKHYLIANNFDGVCREGCSCLIDDFAPCGNMEKDCAAGYKKTHSIKGMWIITTDARKYSDAEIMAIANDYDS